MNEPTKSEAEFVVKPSLPRNVLFSVTCVLFGAYLVHLAHEGRTDALPAYLVALLMTAGSVVAGATTHRRSVRRRPRSLC